MQESVINIYPNPAVAFVEVSIDTKMNGKISLLNVVGQQVYQHTVYRKVPIQECWDVTGKNPITVRWLDINKCDKENRDYRSRLVAQEIKRDKREDLFAATSPSLRSGVGGRYHLPSGARETG